jgi:hypothetical protein
MRGYFLGGSFLCVVVVHAGFLRGLSTSLSTDTCAVCVRVCEYVPMCVE